MRFTTLTTISLLALAACSPKIPDSAAGVTDDYKPASATTQLPQAVAVSSTSLDATPAAPVAPLAPTTTVASAEGADIAAQATAALGMTTTSTSGAPLSAMSTTAATAAPVAVAAATPPATTPIMLEDGTVVQTVAISDEQNFAAVSERESIQSDAARIAANRAQYQVIQPTALPQRPDGSGASIVSFALATNNEPGQPLYKRSRTSESRFQSACAKHGSDDRAQEYFLDNGGPEKDRYGMDPDGDGFACYWDPRPFRAARGGAAELVTHYVDVESGGES